MSTEQPNAREGLLEGALAEIVRRRELAQAAAPSPWQAIGRYVDGHFAVAICNTLRYDEQSARHIAANDPAHVLAVLDAAEATLRRHAPMSSGVVCSSYDCDGWPCPDAAALLDLYAPEDLLEGGAS